MRTLMLAAAVALALVVPVFAQSIPQVVVPRPQAGSTYDMQTGNQYNWNRTPDGSTFVHGSNLGTGSQWNTTIQPNGDMRETDKRGNLWNYNQSTGTYMNTNGRFCTGHGLARVCN